jgi:hypothetical protein
MVGLAAIVLFGIAGLAIDAGRMYMTKAQLSRAADAAALAGVLEIDGTTQGLTDAETVAEAYFASNEPNGTANATANGAVNELTVQASKSVNMIFMSVFGMGPATVQARAKAGFGTVTVDAALVIDSTSSMGDSPCDSEQDNSGCPIHEAKEAAKDFKDILLGNSPNGKVAVGVAAWRGCFHSGSDSQSATAPMPNTKTNCVRHDTSGSSLVSTLITNPTTLESMINNINAIGGSGTNVCGGVAKGWEVLEGPGNHLDPIQYPNNRRYMVVLSDGDNNYNGAYSYQSSPASPHTYQTYSCMPPSSCSNVGGQDDAPAADLCYDGTNAGEITHASDNFNGPSSNCPSNFGSTGGTGLWSSGGWTTSGSGTNAPAMITTVSPNDTSCHVRIQGDGSICRSIAIPSASVATLYYYAKDNGWESGDRTYIEVSTTNCTSGFPGTPLESLTRDDLSSSYDNEELDLTAYAGQTIYLRFRGGLTVGNTGEQFYLDTISITTGSPNSDGYLNGPQPGPACNGTPGKRERQLDIRTIEMAQAAKADGVEIFTVAFGVCQTNSTVYTSAQCQPFTTSGGQIGNTDVDNTADQRLMKCIASSAPGTNNHYYYASSASALPTIFTQIAQQIAHRLIE